MRDRLHFVGVVPNGIIDGGKWQERKGEAADESESMEAVRR